MFDGEFNENKKWNGIGKEYFQYEDSDNEEDKYVIEKKTIFNDIDNENDIQLITSYEGEYHNGKRNGKGKEYNKNGLLLFYGLFLDDERYEGIEKEYNKEGRIISEGELKNDYTKIKVYSSYLDDTIEFEGELIDENKWNGKIKEQNKDGIIIIEGEYKKGKFTGKKKEEKDKDDNYIENIYLNGKLISGYNKEYSEGWSSSVLFEGYYSKGKRWKGTGKEFYKNKEMNSKANMTMVKE